MTKDPINILLVDDQPAKFLSYEATLQSLGENLIKAGSARRPSSICSRRTSLSFSAMSACLSSTV